MPFSQHLGSGKRWTPIACWPVSLAYSMSPVSNNKIDCALHNNTQCCPLASIRIHSGMHMCICIPACRHACTHIHLTSKYYHKNKWMSTWDLKEIFKTLSLSSYWESDFSFWFSNISECRIRPLCFFFLLYPLSAGYTFKLTVLCWETSPNMVYCLHVLLILSTFSMKCNQKVSHSSQNKYKDNEENGSFRNIPI